MLRKVQPNAERAGVVPAAVDRDASGRLPMVVAFLSQTSWGEGDPRETGTIMVMAEDGQWKAWVHDRAGQRSCWVSCRDLLGLLAMLEEKLASDDLPWRSDKGTRGAGRR